MNDLVRRQEIEEVLAELSEGFWTRLQFGSETDLRGKSLLERLESEGWKVSEEYQLERQSTLPMTGRDPPFI